MNLKKSGTCYNNIDITSQLTVAEKKRVALF